MSEETWLGTIVVIVVVAVIAIGTLTSHRTTREEMFVAASKPDATFSYEYRFTGQELTQLTNEARTYIDKEDSHGCSWDHDLNRVREYQCDIKVALMHHINDFTPFGYQYYKALFDTRGILYGMIVVKTREWKPGLTTRPLQPKSSEDGPMPPSGKPLASSPSR